MVEVLGMVNTHRKGLLRGRWWLVGPRLIFDQVAAPVPEIMDSNGICSMFHEDWMDVQTLLRFASEI
jgi:hypothetical protein